MLQNDLQETLFTEEQILRRIQELAREIEKNYKGKNLVLVSILKGGVVFLADLTREVRIPHAYDLVGASSYGAQIYSTGQVIITKDVTVPLKGKHVLLIEDIYDSGTTLKVVKDLLDVHSPASVEICALLWKEKKKRRHEIPIKYIGFKIPDVFVVGYGLDYNEKYRNLRCIGVLKPEIYS
ncbi:MAG TPA: hypoxanthine phosphoribosyltransferase [Candidatus Sumerlaeota bacterium]|nr:MAG: Hypoxanthine-guanine phosphoribosyltransferase [candidate division BRC1 bacterium ADurb.Bin183]HOE62615.1 hypoxanthine phosphoribosyltransferase [Candidatus Sumerlaeota bacterium]HRR30955.1 hypoxanthine phosphoribosyltransferase [Candidatus Sumerlaeia bacterium]HON49375.1 hypoxanthine phosphoribosyltransferase [Candidatus Sumerlaeota bacterium]HOR64877.1 hypoxanthine phosphoribosyltransferase [Candidatus Sumerlaeota bacterium]